MQLFNNIQYRISGQVIKTILHPGQATTMLRLLKYPDDFCKSQGLNQLWYKDTSLEPNDTNFRVGYKKKVQYY